MRFLQYVYVSNSGSRKNVVGGGGGTHSGGGGGVAGEGGDGGWWCCCLHTASEVIALSTETYSSLQPPLAHRLSSSSIPSTGAIERGTRVAQHQVESTRQPISTSSAPGSCYDVCPHRNGPHMCTSTLDSRPTLLLCLRVEDSSTECTYCGLHVRAARNATQRPATSKDVLTPPSSTQFVP